MSLQQDLRRAGYRDVEIASSGELCLSNLTEFLSDVILMDIHLPGKLNGIETARKILQDHKTNVIFITGYDDETRDSVSELNHGGYFVKPVLLNSLLELLAGTGR